MPPALPDDIVPSTDSAEVAHFSISASGVLSFNFPPDYEAPPTPPTNSEAPNTYRVVVVAADEPLGAENRKMGYKKVTVNVTDVNETETVTLSLRQAQIGTVVTATYNDLDGESPAGTEFMWKWYLGGSKITEGITPSSGLTSSYTPIGAGSHRVEASYTKTDGSKKAASATIYVRGTPSVPSVPPLFPTGSDLRSVDENSPPGTRVGTAVTATDPGDVLTYTISGANASSYRIGAATGQITVGPRIALDREGIGNPFTHAVSVTATDPAGESAMQPVTITINDVNEDPVITNGDTKASVEENTDIGTVVGTSDYTAYPEVSGDACTETTCTWSLEGPDAGDFNIGNQTDGTLGQLTFKEIPNFEAPADANRDNEYMVTVVVTDAGIEGKGKLSAERDVVVTVTNVNEPIDEDVADNPVVTLSSLHPKAGVPLTATLDDPDGGEKDIKWQWSIGGSVTGATGAPATQVGDISGAESATYTPKANDIGGILTATVMYADAVGPERSGTALAAFPVAADLAAKAPEFDPKPASRSVPENYEAEDEYGTAPYTYPEVGAVVTATDPNGMGDIMTYSLGGTDAGSFAIDQMSGQITVKTGTKLDREAKATYMVTVTATDPGGLSDSVNVTIKLTDEDEAPTITKKDALTNLGPNLPGRGHHQERGREHGGGRGHRSPCRGHRRE